MGQLHPNARVRCTRLRVVGAWGAAGTFQCCIADAPAIFEHHPLGAGMQFAAQLVQCFGCLGGEQ